jgi:hypothetical protein
MIAAAHFENLLFLLFIAVAFFFQLLTRASKASRRAGQRKPGPTPTPPPRPPVETDEQRIRKFLEALGQPPTATPPPPVTERPTYHKPIVLPHVRPFPSPLPPLTTRPADLPQELKPTVPIRSVREARTFVPRIAEAAIFEVQKGSGTPGEPSPVAQPAASEAYAIAAQPADTAEQTRTDIVRLLRSASGLRDAIILREVFGPPRSMEPVDLVRNI